THEIPPFYKGVCLLELICTADCEAGIMVDWELEENKAAKGTVNKNMQILLDCDPRFSVDISQSIGLLSQKNDFLECVSLESYKKTRKVSVWNIVPFSLFFNNTKSEDIFHYLKKSSGLPVEILYQIFSSEYQERVVNIELVTSNNMHRIWHWKKFLLISHFNFIICFPFKFTRQPKIELPHTTEHEIYHVQLYPTYACVARRRFD
ncbi:hypothetical protein ACJX0J_013626, partial [Zea mays]